MLVRLVLDLELGSSWMGREEGGSWLWRREHQTQIRDVGLNVISALAQQRDFAINPAGGQFLLRKVAIRMATIIML